MRDLPDDNLAYPVALALATGQFGSGFLLNTDDAQYLVTAKHVLFDLNSGALIARTGTGISYGRDLVIRVDHQFDFDQLLNGGHLRQHPTADVAVAKLAQLAPVQRNAPAGALQARFVAGVTRTTAGPTVVVAVNRSACRLYADVLVSNEIYIFGYPNSLGLPALPQLDPTRPLLRKGIVAGKNDQLQTIIIDCPLYQGNSGGLVVEAFSEGVTTRHFAAIGVAAQFIPFVERFQSLQYGTINTSIENSGYAVVTPIDRVLELL